MLIVSAPGYSQTTPLEEIPKECFSETNNQFVLKDENRDVCEPFEALAQEQGLTGLPGANATPEVTTTAPDIDTPGTIGAPEVTTPDITTGSIGSNPNSGAGNDGETGSTETGVDDSDPGNSGANNSAPGDPPGQTN